MNPLQVIQKLQANSQGVAVRSTIYRHCHLTNNPLIITGYHLAGDIGAPVALVYGRLLDESPKCLVFCEPRDRDLRFRILAEFASDVIDYINSTTRTDSAAQIITPNQTFANWLFGIVGRFTRSSDYSARPGQVLPPARIPRAGKFLSFYHNLPPTSSLCIPMADELARHFETGQLASEDLNLHTMLGWINPFEGLSGFESAEIAEKTPPAGPLSDPNWDADKLAYHIDAYNDPSKDMFKDDIEYSLKTAVLNQLLPTWDACVRGYSVLTNIDPAPSVASRWGVDCSDWYEHKSKVDRGDARFASILTPINSAKKIRFFERKVQDMEAEMALDDPLIMARFIANGEAVCGEVIAVDPNRKIIPEGKKKPCKRPLIEIVSHQLFHKPVGTILFSSLHPDIETEIVSIDGLRVTVQVNKGANLPKTQYKLPAIGDEIVLSPLQRSPYYPQAELSIVPWTHAMSEDAH